MESIKEYLKFLGEQDVNDKIIKFFTINPNPNDDMVHKFAEKIGIEPDDLETHIYELLTEFIKPIGKHKHLSDSSFDLNELRMGVQVEMEHTDNKVIAKEIAKDHLAECSNYYTRLDRMEKECE